jgi:hypothetical protein
MLLVYGGHVFQMPAVETFEELRRFCPDNAMDVASAARNSEAIED